MSATVRGNFGRLLIPGLRFVYIKEKADQTEEWMKFFSIENSTRKFEEELGNAAFGAMPAKSEGSPTIFESPAQGYYTTFTHISYGLGFIVTREMFEDDQYGLIMSLPRNLKRSAIQTREVVAANIFNNGFTDSAAFLGGDGEPLFGDATTNHPRIDGGTWANKLGTAADLSQTSLIDMCNILENAVNEKGLPLHYKPKKLIVPLELKDDARVLLKSGLQPGSANNDYNSILDEELKYCVWHYLTDNDAWFLCTDQNEMSLRAFVRRADDLEMGSDFDTQNAKYLATMRMSFGWGDPRGVTGSPGA